MKISLIFPPIEGYENKIPPIGLAYLASIILQEGAEVAIHDLNISNESLDNSISKILAENPDLIGISSSTPAVPKTLEIAEKIKKINSKIKIIVGGPHASILYQELLDSPWIDFCARGEGENIMREIVRCFKNKKPLAKILGISYKRNKKIISNSDMPLIENLDSLPFPAWYLFDLKKYKNFVSNEKLSLPIVTSRGCPFNCTFCYKGIFGKRWRFRSPKNIIEELKYIIKKFHIEEFSIADDNFTLNPKRAIEFCEHIIKNKIKIKWRCTNGIRADLASHKLFNTMKMAGCYLVAFGVETGDEEILKKINKGETINQIKNAFKIAKEEKLETLGFFMFGNLGENEKTMEKTIRLAKEINPDYAQFSIATPFPGSAMFWEIKKNGKFLINSWKDYVFYEGKPIFYYPGLDTNIITKMYQKAYLGFYIRPTYIYRWLKKILVNPEKIKNLFLGLRQYLNMSFVKRKNRS
jgi:radical SAM superfamily enzyme YgiQ (UPF0313 family)